MNVKLRDGKIIDTEWTIEDLKLNHSVLNFSTSFGQDFPIVSINNIQGVSYVDVHFKHDRQTMTDIIVIRGDFDDRYLIWKKGRKKK